jgi:pyridinium-3,5-biscarboxylic acid mononucleotide sulfurtransferase
MIDEHKGEIHRLRDVLDRIGRMAIAVSGGVDSMTISVVAHRLSRSETEMFHAVSPAVPPRATRRVRQYAEREGWVLRVLDAGEFSDGNYIRNPINRCYYCKSNLYRSISDHTDAILVSGTNLDDLDDYRPGLEAAGESNVRHPYVEAGIDKEAVRQIARQLDLHDLAEIPAAPCLSSRVETGIRIQPRVLVAVNQAEQLVSRILRPQTVRCRVRKQCVIIELDAESLSALSLERRVPISDAVAAIFLRAGLQPQIYFAQYRMGSAFVRNSG